MSSQDLDRLHPQRHDVRLDTLLRLRWLSIIGQTAAVLIVYFGLEFDLPIWLCLAVIAVSALLNVALYLRFRQAQRIAPDRAAFLLAFDITQLALLVFLTGGLENPFAFFFLGPVLISATALPPKMTVALGIFAILCTLFLVYFHYPLPWSPADPLMLTEGYIRVTSLSMILAILFIGIYAWQIAEESRQLVQALAATELALAREQHLAQLDGVAAAAAHALGTPLSTISVVAKELERALDPKSPHAEDVRLLREQVERCRNILAKLNELSGLDEPFDRVPLSVLLEEVAAPHRDFGIAIGVTTSPKKSEPLGARNPAILYGLGNLLENAVDFARERVEILADWDEDTVTVTITDDGPGFAPQIMSRIGEPYVRSRLRRRMYASDDTGLGLGFFIAKTLLERTDAVLTFANQSFPRSGAVVTVRWARAEFERFRQPAPLEEFAPGP